MQASHTKSNTAGQRVIPRLAMINDIAGFGRCSACVSLPVISAMQVQVCPAPTAILSSHLGFSPCHYHDYTPYLRDYLHAWEALGLDFDGLYCGFLGKEKQISIAESFLDTFHPPLFLLDPVMADNGRLYSGITGAYCQRLRQLAARADILVPNLTEACLLTETPYQDSGWTPELLDDLCRRLSHICPGSLVITGIREDNCLLNCIWQEGVRTICRTKTEGASRPGTGDLFASVLAADALRGQSLPSSVKKAADFIALCCKGSEEAGVPVAEGVIFEKYLSRLFPSENAL